MYYSSPEVEVLHRRYAQALIEVAADNNRLDKVAEDFLFLNNLLKQNKDLAYTLYHPEIDKVDKLKLLEDICEKAGLCENFFSFLKLLLNKNRLKIIHGVFLKYRDLYEMRKSRLQVSVKTAAPLNKNQLSRLGTMLGSKLKKNIFIIDSVDPSLIGGLKLKIDSLVYNLSLADRLQFLKEKLTEQ